jgi:hypothetical protein
MKKIFSITCLGLAVAVLTFSSCTKKIDEAYTNPNADVRKPVEQLLPGIIANMVISFSAQGTNFGTQNDAIYIGRYTQFWATNTTNNQYDRMGPAAFNSLANILGNTWGAHYYGQGMNLNKMVEWAAEEEKWDYVGVGLAIRAWSWLSLTNIHGEVILKAAWKDQLTFPYDPQEEVYAEVRKIAHLALTYLERTDGNVSQANLAIGDAFMNGGDVNKWKKFTYGVLARSFNQLTNKPGYNPDSVLYYADRSITTNAENTSKKWSNAGSTGTYSFFAPFRGNIGTLRQSRFIAELMSGENDAFPTDLVDPRAPYIIRENTAGTYKGIRPNKAADQLSVTDQPRNFWGGLFSSTAAPANDDSARYIFRNSPIWPIMTAAEIQFIRAEALYRKGDKPGALEAYKLGLNHHFDELITNYETPVPANLRMTAAKRATWFSNPLNVPTNPASLTLSHIMLQKYIAMYGWGAIETWVDLRRYHYALDTEGGLPVYRDFYMLPLTELWPDNAQKVVHRAFPRGASEFYNQVELAKVGGNLPDYHTKEQWFSIQ